jgi:uncharacterized membrane protein YphA (DoxX/SURF4 family)
MGQEWIGSGWLQLLARISIGALLIAAAASKWRSWDEFAASLGALRIAPAARALARLLPWAELALGCLLVAGLLTRPAALLAAGLFALFAVIVLRAARHGASPELRCAPGLHCQAGGWTVARNLGLAAAALLPALGAPDALAADHLLRSAPAPALVPGEAVPAAGLLLFAVAAGTLLPAVAGLAARHRRAPGV